MKKELTINQTNELVTGEAITLATVLAIGAIAILAVVAYKLFASSKGSTQMPGGWKFTWNQ